MRVGVFDSGLGGINVLSCLIKKYPNNEYIYYGDTLNVPYGNKSREELLILSKNNMEFLINKGAELIIIACGTVSSNCLDYLKASYNIPIISIVSPTIEYLKNSNYKNIGVIATNATINSHIFKNNIINKNVIEIATPELVPIIENNKFDELDMVLHKYLDGINIDVLVLGCTHYPLVKDKISSIISCDIIDMSEYVSISEGNTKGLSIYFSKLDDKIRDNVKRIIK